MIRGLAAAALGKLSEVIEPKPKPDHAGWLALWALLDVLAAVAIVKRVSDLESRVNCNDVGTMAALRGHRDEIAQIRADVDAHSRRLDLHTDRMAIDALLDALVEREILTAKQRAEILYPEGTS